MPSIARTKGPLVIEKPLRDALGLEPGYIASQKLVGDHVEIYFSPPEHDRSLRGILASEAKGSLDPKAWNEIRAQAWAEASSEAPKAEPTE